MSTPRDLAYPLHAARAAGIWTVLAAVAVAAWPTASQAQVYDFTASAGGATWISSGGAVTYDAPFASALGQAAPRSGALEDGTSVLHLSTRPPESGAAQPWFLEGIYSGISIPSTAPLVRFESQVGFETGADGSSGMSFSVWIQHAGEYYQLATTSVKYDSLLTPLWVDLSAYKGQIINIKIRVEAGADGASDLGAWKAPQIVSYGTVSYDFVAQANHATRWFNGSDQNVAFGAGASEVGGALWFSGSGEDGAAYTNALYTHPDWLAGATTHCMEGQFDSVPVPGNYAKAKFIGRVGFVQGAAGTDGITYQLVTPNTRGGFDFIARVDAQYDGRFDYFTADLTKYRGQSRTFYLLASAGATTSSDWGYWIEAKIVGYDPPMVYDFAANAGLAAWSTGAGSILYNGSVSSNGYVQMGSGALEDGVPYANRLLTLPNTNGGATSSFIQGVYDNVTIPSNLTNVTFNATVGLQQDANGGDGVTYQVFVKRRGQSDTYCVAKKTYTGGVLEISGNLSGFQGQNVSIILKIDPGASAVNDAACWVNPRIIAEAPFQVYAADAGAAVNDGADDLAAVNRALALAKAASPSEIQFGAGTYNLSDKIVVDQQSNVNLRGAGPSAAGTLLMCGNPLMGAIWAAQSSNISVRNFAIDYNPLPFTQGTISNVNLGARKFDLTIDPGYSELDEPRFANWKSTECSGAIHEAAPPYRAPQNTVDAVYLSAWTKTGGVYHCTASSPLDGMTSANQKFSYMRRGQSTDAVCVVWNPDTMGHVAWDYVAVYAAPGLTFVGAPCEKMFVRNCSVMLRPGTNRIASSNGDGVHTRDNNKGPDIIDCVIQGERDDGTNNCSNPTLIVASTDATHLTIYPPVKPSVGDHFWYYRPSTGSLGNTAADPVTVVSVGPWYISNNVAVYDIVLDRAPNSTVDAGWTDANGLPIHDCLWSVEHGGSNTVVDGCTFSDYHGTGVFNKGLSPVITNNTISNLPGVGILLCNGPWGLEGYRSNGALIENNTVTRCAYSRTYIDDTNPIFYTVGAIRVQGLNGAMLPAASYIHDGVIIRNNTVTDWPRHAIYVCSSKNVTIQGNVCTNTTAGVKSSSNLRGAMMFDNVAGTIVQNNTIVDNRPASQITGMVFQKNTPAGELSLIGNTFTTNLPSFVPELMTVTSYTGSAPLIDFTASPRSGLWPLPVTFSSSTGSSVAWGWDFANGGAWDSTNTISPMYTYTAPGTYSVKLAASNAYGSAAKVRAAYIAVGGEGRTGVRGWSHFK